MIPHNQLGHPINMKGVDSKQNLYSKIKEKIAARIPYRVSFWYQRQDILHPTRLYENTFHVLKWIPILWKDRDWDHAHLYSLMAFKLKMMKEHHRKYRVIGDWKKVADEIEVAEEALNRLIKDNYCENEWKEHYKKFPSKWPNHKNWKRTAEGYLIQPRPARAESTSLRRNCKLEEKARQADMDLFCKMFMDYSRGWWD